MPAWDGVEDRCSIIKDACDLTAIRTFRSDLQGYEYVILARLAPPRKEPASAPAEAPKRETSSRRRTRNKILTMLKCRRPQRPA
jgi:hypothetical protein